MLFYGSVGKVCVKIGLVIEKITTKKNEKL